MKKNFFALSTLLIFNSACSLFGIHNTEEPRYTVLKKEDNKELRKYQSYIVAKTTATGDYKEAQTKAFRKLAGYIFGKNKSEQNISMTTPVTQQASDSSQKIAMTTPVQQQKKEGKWEMSFMMPSKYKLENLPSPVDPSITFAKVPESYIAAISYSWYTDEEKNTKKANELLMWLKKHTEFQTVADPRFAGYDPPWTLPFFRKNEILIKIDKVEK